MVTTLGLNIQIDSAEFLSFRLFGLCRNKFFKKKKLNHEMFVIKYSDQCFGQGQYKSLIIKEIDT